VGITDLALYALIASAVVAVLALVSYGVVAVALVVMAMAGIRLPGPVRLGRAWIRLLKLHHLVSAACWLGGAVTMIVLTTVAPVVMDSAADRQALARILALTDQWVIIPSALSTVTGGLILSFLSGWTLRFSWVLAKAVAGCWSLAVGWWLVTPRIMDLADRASAGTMPSGAGSPDLFAPGFFVLGSIQFCLILSMLALSVFKPWDRDEIIEH